MKVTSARVLSAVLGCALMAGGVVAGSPAYAGEAAPSVAGEPAFAAPPAEESDSASPHGDLMPSGSLVPNADEPPVPTPTPSPTTPTPPPPNPLPTATPSPTEPFPTSTVEEDDVTAPSGSYSLNASAAWVGQTVTLTELSLVDDVTPRDEIVRVVNWGDGSAPVTLPVGQTTISRTYAKVGSFPVSVTLTDTTGNTDQAKVTEPFVLVTVPGVLKLSKTTVWNHETFRTSISGVQPGTTRIVLNWGDGFIDTVEGRDGWMDGWYYHNKKTGKLVKGAVTIRATFYNALGSSQITGKVTIRRDAWRPLVKVNKPKTANRVASWKYITGTASDKGAGLEGIYVFVVKTSGSKVYCYTPKLTWKKVTTQAQLNNCLPVRVGHKKGKWSVRLLSVAKGWTIYVDARSWDWSDLNSRWSSVSAKLTRS